MPRFARRRMEIVMLLLKNGANPNHVDKDGLDPLMCACVFGQSKNVAFWLAEFPNWNIERKEKVAGYRALTLAVMFGPDKLPTIKKLLEKGADPRACLNTGASIITTTGE